MMMTSTDESGDGRISFQEYVEAVYYKTNSKGESNASFRGLVDAVSFAFVHTNDEEVGPGMGLQQEQPRLFRPPCSHRRRSPTHQCRPPGPPVRAGWR